MMDPAHVAKFFAHDSGDSAMVISHEFPIREQGYTNAIGCTKF